MKESKVIYFAALNDDVDNDNNNNNNNTEKIAQVVTLLA
jgi:hypothetical protein